jgi:uncharacterized protein involved in cysteine biosynthesis
VILGDFTKALGQLFDRPFLRVLLLGLALTVGLLVAICALFIWGANWIVPDTVTLPGGFAITWLDDILSAVSVMAVLLLSVFLMVPVASAFTGLFLDDVAEAVEARHYPGLPPVPRVPWRDVLTDSVNFLVLMLVVNIVAVGLYFVVGPFGPLLFWVVNGFLLGREYFQMVAMRRLGRIGAIAARKRHRGRIWIAGILMAAPLSIPVVNLFVPILGAATFTHMFHRLERSGG